MGKSELLSKWVWDLSENKQADQLYQHIFFIDCSNGLEKAFEGNSLQARMLEIQSDDTQKLTSAQVKLTEYNQDGKLLLVLDDLPWNETQFKHNANLVNQFKKVADCVIATSRREYSNFQPISIGTLKKDTVDLFKSYYQKGIANDTELAMVNEIIQRAGMHTLTIEILAKTAYENDWSIAELLTTLKKADFDYKELTTEVEYTKSDNTEEQTLNQALQVLFDISQLDTGQKEILYHLSCLNSQLFTLQAVKQWLNVDIPIIKKLVKLGWIQESITDESITSYQLHQTITHTIKHAFINNVDELKRHQQMSVVAERMELSYENINPEQLGSLCLSAISAYFLESISHISELDDMQQELITNRMLVFSIFLINHAVYGIGIDFLEKSRKIIQTTFGRFDSTYASVLHNLASLYDKVGSYQKALFLYQQSAEIVKIVVGENHPDYASSLNNLALLYESMGRFNDALPLYTQSIVIKKIALGENHPDYATSLNNLAGLYESMGRYDDALSLYEQSTQIKKTSLGENHSSYATSLNNLALLYYSMGRYDDALPLYEKSTKIYKTELGENHPDYASSLNNLALLYERIGRFNDALLSYQQSTQIRKTELGENHPDYASSLNNLALLYENMARFNDALPLYQQSTKIRKTILGENHPDYASSLNNLAVLYCNMGRYNDAVKYSENAVQIAEKVLGISHPHTAIFKKGLEYLKWQLKK